MKNKKSQKINNEQKRKDTLSVLCAQIARLESEFIISSYLMEEMIKESKNVVEEIYRQVPL